MGDMGTCSSASLGSNTDGDILGEYTGLLCQEAAGTGTSWAHRDTTDKQVAAGAKIPTRVLLLPWGERCHEHRTLIIALQGQHHRRLGFKGFDLGFKGFSLESSIPQCSPCHSPAVTQWGQGEDTGLDTDKCSMVLAWSRMVTIPPSPLSLQSPGTPVPPCQLRGTALSPTAGQLGPLGSWHQCPPFLFP